MIIICAIFAISTSATATSMYCSASVQDSQSVIAKVHEAIQKTLQYECKTKSCKKNVNSFVTSLPPYPVILDLHNLTFEEIPYVDRYHASICYERAEGEVPACNKLFAGINQPNPLESKLKIYLTNAKLRIHKLRSFESRAKDENWLVADLHPLYLPGSAPLKLHISLFATKDKSFLKKAKRILTKTLSDMHVTIRETSCRMGKY